MEIVYIILIIALFVTIIRYPKEVGNLIIGFVTMPFKRAWDILFFISLPFQFIILIVEDKLNVNYLTRYLDNSLKKSKYKTQSRKPVNFTKFKKYILLNSNSSDIESQLNEAKDTCLEVDIKDMNISSSEQYTIVELPHIGFYGFNFLIQWLADHFKQNEVYGFSTNGRSKFFSFNDLNEENNLVGLTDKGKSFWISMYDDLDKKQFLRLNNELKLDTTLTTNDFEELIKKAI